MCSCYSCVICVSVCYLRVPESNTSLAVLELEDCLIGPVIHITEWMCIQYEHHLHSCIHSFSHSVFCVFAYSCLYVCICVFFLYRKQHKPSGLWTWRLLNRAAIHILCLSSFMYFVLLCIHSFSDICVSMHLRVPESNTSLEVLELEDCLIGPPGAHGINVDSWLACMYSSIQWYVYLRYVLWMFVCFFLFQRAIRV